MRLAHFQATQQECLARRLLGLRASDWQLVSKCKRGTFVFLYNYTQRNMLGIYRAASDGLLNYNSDAWPRLACLLRPKCTEVLLGAVGAGCGLTLLVLAVD